MTCQLCGKEHNGQYVIKVQEYYTKTDKINLVDAGVCKDCAMGIVGKIYVFVNSTQVGKNVELRVESEMEEGK